jgi:hypothetical protein
MRAKKAALVAIALLSTARAQEPAPPLEGWTINVYGSTSEVQPPAPRGDLELEVTGLGEAETAWIRDYHQSKGHRLIFANLSTVGLDHLQGRLVVSYADQAIKVTLVQGDFNPSRTATVVAYPSPYLVYQPLHAARLQALALFWVQSAIVAEGRPLSLRPALGNASLYAGFERPDMPGIAMVIGCYLWDGRPKPLPPVNLIEKGRVHAITPAYVGDYWHMAPMMGPDGRETETAKLWRFMSWDKDFPEKSGRPLPSTP